MYEIKGLNKFYNEETGVRNFEVSIQAGEVVLLLGPNGAGKTTAFRAMLGLTKSSWDKFTCFGKPFERQACLPYIGAMIGKPSFYEYFTGRETLSLYGKGYGYVDENQVDSLLKAVGLAGHEDKKVLHYSTGMKQRLDLARALLHRPKIVMLDEPFAGMDIEGKRDLKKFIKSYLDQYHAGFIISSHMVGDLAEMATKVLIIDKGKTLFYGPVEVIRNSGLTLEEYYLQTIDWAKKGDDHGYTKNGMDKAIS